MSEDGIARVDRLVGWIKRFRQSLLDGRGEVSPVKLDDAMRRDETKAQPQYWSDILRKAKPSFAAKKALAAPAAPDRTAATWRLFHARATPSNEGRKKNLHHLVLTAQTPFGVMHPKPKQTAHRRGGRWE